MRRFAFQERGAILDYLNDVHKQKRVDFALWMLAQMNADPRFLDRVFFSDEASIQLQTHRPMVNFSSLDAAYIISFQ